MGIHNVYEIIVLKLKKSFQHTFLKVKYQQTIQALNKKIGIQELFVIPFWRLRARKLFVFFIKNIYGVFPTEKKRSKAGLQ